MEIKGRNYESDEAGEDESIRTEKAGEDQFPSRLISCGDLLFTNRPDSVANHRAATRHDPIVNYSSRTPSTRAFHGAFFPLPTPSVHTSRCHPTRHEKSFTCRAHGAT